MTMISKTQKKNQLRARRRARVRARVVGTTARPRLTVFRSLKGLSVQIIDDTVSKTLVSVNGNKMKGDAGERKGKVATSYLMGKAIAEKAKAANITTVVFDRAGYAYHGRIRAVAEGARDGGLVF